MEAFKRLREPTPKFWRKVRNAMIAVGTVSGIILTAPVSLPALVVTVAGYGLVAGSVGTVLSQMTREDK